MGVYDRFIKSAKRLISRYGEQCTWISEQQSEDPDSPWNSGEEDSIKSPVKIAFFPNDNSGFETIAKALGADVSMGNVIGYMPNVNFEVSDKDSILRTIAGKNLTINSIDEINPNGEKVVLYVLKCTQ